jgi:hypothetical protein
VVATAMEGRTLTVRDLFMKALAMKTQDVPSTEIRAELRKLASEAGHRIVSDVDDGEGYELAFATGERIRFDGATYYLN